MGFFVDILCILRNEQRLRGALGTLNLRKIELGTLNSVMESGCKENNKMGYDGARARVGPRQELKANIRGR